MMIIWYDRFQLLCTSLVFAMVSSAIARACLQATLCLIYLSIHLVHRPFKVWVNIKSYNTTPYNHNISLIFRSIIDPYDVSCIICNIMYAWLMSNMYYNNSMVSLTSFSLLVYHAYVWLLH